MEEITSVKFSNVFSTKKSKEVVSLLIPYDTELHCFALQDEEIKFESDYIRSFLAKLNLLEALNPNKFTMNYFKFFIYCTVSIGLLSSITIFLMLILMLYLFNPVLLSGILAFIS